MDVRLLLVLCFIRMKGTISQKCLQKAAAVNWAIYYKMKGSSIAQALYPGDATKWTPDVELHTQNEELRGLIDQAKDAAQQYNVIAYSNFPPMFRSAVECSSSARGILAWKAGEEAWYITHSADQWPDFHADKAPDGPKAALFVCITVPSDKIGDFAKVLDYQDPIVYYYRSGDAQKKLEEIAEAKPLITAPGPRYTPYVKNLKFTIGDTNVRVAGKLSAATSDVYSSYLSVLLKRNLTVWSKPQSGRLLNSSCATTYKVENVEPKEIEVNDNLIARADDSSSWAVSIGGKFFCASNADRTEEGKRMGAGILCLQQEDVNQRFRSIAKKAKTQACN